MRHGLTLFAAIVVAGVVGCGSSTTQDSASGGKPGDFPPPDAMVAEFLEGIRSGNDAKAASLLTPLARQKTAEMGLEVAPPASETAKFKVGQVEYVAEDGAHVATDWMDVDENGQQTTDAIIWMVRRENDGWRVAGMATKVFEDQPPLFLNFEDPDDMMRKQKLVAEEIQRRTKAGEKSPSETPVESVTEAPDKPVVR